MRKFIAVFIGVALISLASISGAWAADPIRSDEFNSACNDPKMQSSTFCQSVGHEARAGDRVLGPSGILTTVAQFIVYITGAVSVIMVIIGGFRYALSGGDSNATKGAKDTIMYAVIGLVVAIFSQVIVTFVLSRL